MQAQQISVKVFARQEQFDQGALIPIFHKWIREDRLADTILIDVADYRHVPKGPGIMLIAHEAHYGLDQGGGRTGLLYARKRDDMGDPRPKLERALAAALLACDALEREPAIHDALSFDAAELEIHIMSRLAARNTEETFRAFEPIVQELGRRVYDGAAISLEHLAGERRPFGVRVRASGEHSVRDVRARLGALS